MTVPGTGTAPPVTSAAGGLPRIVLRGTQIDTWNMLLAVEGTELKVGGLTVLFHRQPSLRPRGFRHLLKWVDLTGTRTALVALQTFPFAETHGADLRAENLDTLPVHLGTALESSALALTSDRLSRAGMKARAVEAGSDLPPADAIDVVVRFGGLYAGEVALRLCGTPSALVSLAQIEGMLALAPVSPLAEAVLAPLAVCLEDIVLTASEVAGLESGDVLLLDGTPQRNLMLTAMKRRFGVELMQQGWMITEIGMEGDRPHAGADGSSIAPGNRHGDTAMPDPSQLPVVVVLELATVEIPIGQLATWSPGALVDIGLGDVSAGLPVTVKIGGRQMAQGDLVRIDDRFAVRLSRVGPWSTARDTGA